jgi:hypothetical protein
MRKVFITILLMLFVAVDAHTASRDDNSVSRIKSGDSGIQRSATNQKNAATRATTNARSSVQSVDKKPSNVSVRNTNFNTRVKSDDTKQINARIATTQTTNLKKITTRAATDNSNAIPETKTGAAYDQCKSAYFTCMDQFCALKNDNYRRCSCSDRIYNLEKTQNTLQSANEELTAFN